MRDRSTENSFCLSFIEYGILPIWNWFMCSMQDQYVVTCKRHCVLAPTITNYGFTIDAVCATVACHHSEQINNNINLYTGLQEAQHALVLSIVSLSAGYNCRRQPKSLATHRVSFHPSDSICLWVNEWIPLVCQQRQKRLLLFIWESTSTLYRYAGASS